MVKRSLARLEQGERLVQSKSCRPARRRILALERAARQSATLNRATSRIQFFVNRAFNPPKCSQVFFEILHSFFRSKEAKLDACPSVCVSLIIIPTTRGRKKRLRRLSRMLQARLKPAKLLLRVRDSGAHAVMNAGEASFIRFFIAISRPKPKFWVKKQRVHTLLFR
jgi:hypothetical protein